MKLSKDKSTCSFLDWVSLMNQQDMYDEEEDRVTLMTFHCAKGLQFPVVFLAGMEEGLYPHRKSAADNVEMEEERRLCYVGVTRAMKHLYLTYAESRRINGAETLNRLSRSGCSGRKMTKRAPHPSSR